MARVLVANDLYGRSSAAGVAVRMAEGLAGRGHQVTFLGTVRSREEERRFHAGGIDVRLARTPAYAPRWRAWRSLSNPAGLAAMTDAVEALQPDVVHVHNLHIHLSYASLAAAGARNAKVVLHVHDIMPVCHQKLFCHLDERLVPGDEVTYESGPIKCPLCVRGRYNPLRNGSIRRALERNVDQLVAVSDEMGRALAHNHLGTARTIYNGIPMDEGDVDETVVEQLAARLHLSDRRVIFYGGRLDRLKGGLELVRALERVRREHADVMLLTVGEALPGFYDEMVSLAGRLGIGDALVHAGWLTGDELAAAYRLANVVATPSLCFESFGLVNLEAMRASRPVVASMWGGPSELVVDGETGYLVNPLQVDVLADRLARLLGDTSLAERMGRAGRRRAEATFGLEHQIDRVEELYTELLS